MKARRPRARRWVAIACAGLGAACPAAEDHPEVPKTSATSNLSAPIPPATNVELPADVVPKRYRLDLTIDPSKTRFSGRGEIDVDVAKATNVVVLHAKNLELSKTDLVSSGKTYAAARGQRRAFGARESEEELILRFAEEVPAGPATLRFEWDAPFANLNGIYRADSEGRWFAFTQMEPTHARHAFPSFDEPRYKTPFEVTLSIPAKLTAFANAQEVGRQDVEGMTRIRFAPTEPIPTYLFALAVGDLETMQGATAPTPIRFIAPRGRASLGGPTLEATEKTLKVLETYFERPHPYPKLDIVSVPNFGAGAMENVGLVTFREELVLLDDRSPALMRRRMQIIMAHELAHQWFGNLVTMRWWDDLWLNEGFATWMAPKTCDDAFPQYEGKLERVLDRAYAMNADVLPSARAVRPKVDKADQIREAGGWTAYQKGAAVLTMLESWIGEDTFRKAIQEYVNASAGRSITSTALFAALDGAAKKPVSKVAASFLDQPGLPIVDVSVTCGKTDKDPATAALTAKDAAGGNRTWTVPICLSVVGEQAPVCTVMESDKATVALPRCAAVFPNRQEAGYFRYSLDAAADKRLRGAFSKLDASERAGYILNAWALVLLGRAEARTVVELLNELAKQKETSRIVVDAMIFVLYDLDRHYVDEANASDFGALVKKLLEPHRARLGMPSAKKKEHDTVRIHRAAVLGALADLADHPAVAKDLEAIAAAYLKDPSKADPDLGPLAIRVSARAGGAGKNIDENRLAASKTPDERVALVAALSSLKPAEDLKRTLEMFVKGTIKSGDWRHLRTAALRYRDGRRVFYDHLIARFDAMNEQLGHAGALTSTIGATCDAKDVDRLTKFFEPKLASLASAQRGFEEGVAEAKRCLAIRSKGAPSFR